MTISDAFVADQKILQPVDRFEIEVVGRLVEQQRLRIAEQRLRQQHAHFLAALQLAHLALVQRFGNIQAVEQDGGVALRRVAVFFADNAFEFAQPHAVLVGEVGLGVQQLAFFERLPQPLVAHDDGVDDAEFVEGELVLAQHAELLRARDTFPSAARSLAGEQLHEGGLAGAVRAGQAVAAAG